LQRDTLRAITYFERCLKQDSTIVVAYRRLYNLFIIQNDWDNAIRVLENARRAENTWEFNFYLAHCLMLKGNYSEAILALDSAIALNPFNYYQFIFQGDAYLNNGDRVKAKELYERARDLDPNLNDAFDRLKNLH
jgi:tetratricopeptide (TPR) repeat protein